MSLPCHNNNNEDPARGTPLPRISVVIPVLNEVGSIAALLNDLRAQDPVAGGFEVLVVDGGSSDGTPAVVRRQMDTWKALRFLENPLRRSGPARNVGARASRGEYVLFIDGHCRIPRRDYLSHMAEVLERTGAQCLSRPQPLDPLAGGTWSRAVSSARRSPLGHHPGSAIFSTTAGFVDPRSAGAAYRRELIDKLGGYDVRFDACEDVEFNYRVRGAGIRAYHDPAFAIDYRPRNSPGGLWRQMLRYGRGRAGLMLKHRECVPWLLLAASAAAGAALLIGILGGTAGRTTVVLALGVWGLADLAEGLRTGGVGLEGLRTALCLLIIQIGLVAGFWQGLLRARRFRGAARAGPGETP